MTTTLAARYLKEGKPLAGCDAPDFAADVDATIKAYLGEPKHLLAVLNREKRDRAFLPEDLPIADRFIFRSHPAKELDLMIKAGALTLPQMGIIAKLPSPFCWFEWIDGERRIGLLIIHDPFTETYKIIEVHDYGHAVCPASLLRTTPLPWKFDKRSPNGTHAQEIHILWHALGHSSEAAKSDGSVTTGDFLSAAFLLSVPKVVEITPKHKVGIRRAWTDTDTEYPPIEYKRVTCTIGGTTYRQAFERKLGESESEYTKRLHHVVGHFRTYHHYPDGRDRPTPHTAYIPPHWRGDATKGLLLTERVMDTGVKPNE